MNFVFHICLLFGAITNLTFSYMFRKRRVMKVHGRKWDKSIYSLLQSVWGHDVVCSALLSWKSDTCTWKSRISYNLGCTDSTNKYRKIYIKVHLQTKLWRDDDIRYQQCHWDICICSWNISIGFILLSDRLCAMGGQNILMTIYYFLLNLWRGS